MGWCVDRVRKGRLSVLHVRCVTVCYLSLQTFVATELNKTFSGRQPGQDVKVSDVSRTYCVPTFKVGEPKPMVWFWFYQAISNTLKNGTQSVILTRLSARERFIELRLFVLCNKNQLDAIFRLTVSWPAGWPTDCQLKSTARTSCIYTVYLLMMGYKYTRNMYRLIDEINQG